MKKPFEKQDAELLLLLQQGIELVTQPFLPFATALGLSEAEVLERTRGFFKQGLARRFGAVFNSSSLGYASTLCAVAIPADKLSQMVEKLIPNPGITHAYQRADELNFWFTVTAPAESLTDELERIAAILAPYQLLNLSAGRTFKKIVIFDLREQKPKQEEALSKPHSSAMKREKLVLNESEQEVVRQLQGNLPITAELFAETARRCGYGQDEFIELLRRWKQAGALRRIGLLVHHHQLGFTGNSMCVWKVADDKMDAAGQVLAAQQEVSHCYERVFTPQFPFNLYAMIHAPDTETAKEIYVRISEAAGLSGGRMLFSIHEFKKTSPSFFLEESGNSAANT